MKFFYYREIFLAFLACKIGFNLAAVSLTNVKFSITNYIKCIVPGEGNFITTLINLSLQQCANECGNRAECQALNYHRRTKICDLLSKQTGDLVTNNVQTGPCVMVLKSDIQALQGRSCPIGEVCDGQFCDTKECQLETPKNAQIVGNLNDIGSRIFFNCSPGYTNIGEEYAACLQNGTWNHQPMCLLDCGTPTTVPDANLSFSATTESAVVVYTCQSGYTMTFGDSVHTCTSGVWNGILPICKTDCGTPTTVPDANLSFSATTESAVVVYTCQSGYTMTFGDSVHTCTSGVWSGILPICKIDCGTPTTVPDANLSFSATTESAVVVYTCQSGYTMTFGDSVHTCTSGVWSGILPICKIDCGTPTTVPDANLSFSATTESAVVVYTCQSGYTMTFGDSVHTCTSGVWSGILPICKIDCGTPTTVPDANLSFSATTESAVVVYTCKSGYTMTFGDSVHTCTSGVWNGILPICKTDCLEPPFVPSSVVSNGSTYEGNQRTYTCDPGKYFYSGTSAITTICQSNSQWSNMDVICPTGGDYSECPGCGILRDCEDVQTLGAVQTGIYIIYPSVTAVNALPVSVRCDMDTSFGGWTVIQRRISNSDFYKTWREYKNGFGNVSDNYWLGNEYISILTSLENYKIRFDLYDQDNVFRYAEYGIFSLSSESQDYTLKVEGFSGTAGDSLTYHSGMKFTTKDVDNDYDKENCAVKYSGAWWYKSCHASNLNGIYGNTDNGRGMNWFTFKGHDYSLSKTEIRIKRN